MNTWWCSALGFSVTFISGLLASICVDCRNHDRQKIRWLTMYGKSSVVEGIIEPVFEPGGSSLHEPSSVDTALLADVVGQTEVAV